MLSDQLRNYRNIYLFLTPGMAQGLRLVNFVALQRSGMLATILIVVMILLQTGALSFGLMVDRRFITAAASLNRKSVHSKYMTGNGPKGAGLGNRRRDGA